MIVLYAAIGFVLGFCGGLFIINLFLRHYPSHELIKNKSLRWTYGLFVWIFAGIGLYAGIWFYDRSFF